MEFLLEKKDRSPTLHQGNTESVSHVKHLMNICKPRMHSSRMRTGRSLTVCWSVLPAGGVCSGGRGRGMGGLLRGGVCSRGGSPCLGEGGSGLGGEGVSALGGVLPAWGGGRGCGLVRGGSVPGGLLLGRGGSPCPETPPCEQNHTHV